MFKRFFAECKLHRQILDDFYFYELLPPSLHQPIHVYVNNSCIFADSSSKILVSFDNYGLSKENTLLFKGRVYRALFSRGEEFMIDDDLWVVKRTRFVLQELLNF